jgi:hypothetical protein
MQSPIVAAPGKSLPTRTNLKQEIKIIETYCTQRSQFLASTLSQPKPTGSLLNCKPLTTIVIKLTSSS